MDKRVNNGGKRKGAGRKPKAAEIELIETLDQQIDQVEVIKKLEGLIRNGNLKAIQLYFNYRYGKPKEFKEIEFNNMQPIFELPSSNYEEAEVIEDEID